MDAATVSKIVTVFFLSAVKFLWAPGTSMVAGFTFFETVVITTAGGIFGITVFYFFGKWVVAKMEMVKRKTGMASAQTKTKVFNKRNRRIIKFKSSFGLIGLVIVTPTILSIPIGCILAAKFYRHQKKTYPLLLISTFLWSLAVSVAVYYVKTNIF